MHSFRRKAGAAMRAAARRAEESAGAEAEQQHEHAPHMAGWVTGDQGWLGNEDEEAFIEIAPILSPERKRACERILRISALVLIWAMAFTIRLFPVVRYESMIHEYDPYFNYRATAYLAKNGFLRFFNWFDERSWYPLGRSVGQTIYPGLHSTAAVLFWGANAIGVRMSVKTACVFLGPIFSGATCVSTYLLACECGGGRGSGLVSAALIALAPAYSSRSVAGAFDNEAVAIFAMVTTFYLFVASVRTGSVLRASLASVSYLYMVSTWGGYTYVANLLPLYVVVSVIYGRYTSRLYVAYSIFYTVGTLLSMQIVFVGFQAVQTMEHMLAVATFIFLQGYALVSYLDILAGRHAESLSRRDSQPTVASRANDQGNVSPRPGGDDDDDAGPRPDGAESTSDAEWQARYWEWRKGLVQAVSCTVLLAVLVTAGNGCIRGFAERTLALLDPTYATAYMPIVASVSEHQPCTWTTYFLELHMIIPMLPVGLYFMFRGNGDAELFVILYLFTSAYFAGMMRRMLLVLAPAAAVVAGTGISAVLRARMRDMRASNIKGVSPPGRLTPGLALASVLAVAWLLWLMVEHGIYCTSEIYSSPSVVMTARGPDGERIVLDDFREAYRWMAHNLPAGSKVMSWWDYGYQMAAMGNKNMGVDDEEGSISVVVDNNTWNNTHIAAVGAALVSTEDVAWQIMDHLGVDYVMVVFGGNVGYASDDINKFMWPVKIAGGIFDGGKKIGSVMPRIREDDYLVGSEYKVGKHGAEALHKSLLFKMCYHRFAEDGSRVEGRGPGFDKVRGESVEGVDTQLLFHDEVFSTQNWLVRIYKRKKLNRGLAQLHAGLARGKSSGARNRG